LEEKEKEEKKEEERWLGKEASFLLSITAASGGSPYGLSLAPSSCLSLSVAK